MSFGTTWRDNETGRIMVRPNDGKDTFWVRPEDARALAFAWLKLLQVPVAEYKKSVDDDFRRDEATSAARRWQSPDGQLSFPPPNHHPSAKQINTPFEEITQVATKHADAIESRYAGVSFKKRGKR